VESHQWKSELVALVLLKFVAFAFVCDGDGGDDLSPLSCLFLSSFHAWPSCVYVVGSMLLMENLMWWLLFHILDQEYSGYLKER